MNTMAEKTTNYNLTKPSAEDFYDVGVHNENMDIIDAEMKRMDDESKRIDNDTKTNLETHLKASNPHKITAATVGLGNVPNVATNDQTPTYTETSTLTNIASGEKLSVTFGKIKKSITDLISHLADNVKHITASERTSWNAKAPTNHASSATTYGVGTGSNYGHLKITDSKTSTATDTAASAKALKEVNDKVVEQGFELVKTQDIVITDIPTSDKTVYTTLPITGLDISNYNELIFDFVVNVTMEDNPNVASYAYRSAVISFNVESIQSWSTAAPSTKQITIGQLDFNGPHYYGKDTEEFNLRTRFSCHLNKYQRMYWTGTVVNRYYSGATLQNNDGTIEKASGDTFNFMVKGWAHTEGIDGDATANITGVVKIYGRRGL